MIECFNEKCTGNKGNKCIDKLMNIGSSLVGCPTRLKSKDDVETLKVICINDQTEAYPNYKGNKTAYKTNGITKDKIYEVEQSEEYEEYYNLLNNDLGEKQSYKKDRFKIVEGEKTKEKELKARCIDNSNATGELTKNKVYRIIEIGAWCTVENDFGHTVSYKKDRFKPVEPQKENRCYNENCLKSKLGECKVPCSVRIDYKVYKSLEKIANVAGEEPQADYSNKGKAIINHMKAISELKWEKPLNYEEEYNKLQKAIVVKDKRIAWLEEQKETGELNNDCRLLQSEIKELEEQNEELKNVYIKDIESRGLQLESMDKQIEELKINNEKLRKTNATNYDEYKESIEMLKEENEKLIDNSIKQGREIAELKKQNNQGYMEQMNKTLNEKNEEIDRLNKIAESAKNTSKRLDEVEEENYVLKCQYEESKKRIKMLEDVAGKVKEQLENYKLLKRMIKVLIEGL